MKNGIVSTMYDVLVNVGRGHEDGLRAYAACAVGTPKTKVGKALGVANVVIALAAFSVGMGVLTVKAYEAGEHIGESLDSRLKALKERKRKMRELEARAQRPISNEAKEGLEDYIGKCRNTVSFADMEALADRAVKRAESRDLTNEEAEELGL